MSKSYPIVIQNGYDVVYEISVVEWHGKCSYSLKGSDGHFTAISKEQFENIMEQARTKGYYVFDYGTFM